MIGDDWSDLLKVRRNNVRSSPGLRRRVRGRRRLLRRQLASRYTGHIEKAVATEVIAEAGRKWGVCPLCGLTTNLTEHHAIWPGRKPGSHYFDHPKRPLHVILICEECHLVIHQRYPATRYREVG